MRENAARRATYNARRRERRAQDPDRRARDAARCRAYYQAHKQQILKRTQAYARAHRQEINERNRADYHAHKHENKPEARRAYLKRCFGISPAEYDALLAKQNGACAICRRRSKRRLCVDHCHVTGRIRGLLCHFCNLALGYLRDDQASLVAALAYLGALPRDAAGCAAQRALAVHAVLPPWPTRRAVLTHPPVRFDAAPPAGGKPTNPMRDALDAELARASEDGEGHQTEVLQLIARKLAAKALEGDLGAIREIFDRIDGKTVAGSAPEQPQRKLEIQWNG